MTAPSGPSTLPDDGQLLRLRQQLSAREEVVKQLNRRLVELELGEPIEPQLDEALVDGLRQRITELDRELRTHRAALEQIRAEREVLDVQIEQLQLEREANEHLPAVRWSHRLRRIKALVRRLTAR